MVHATPIISRLPVAGIKKNHSGSSAASAKNQRTFHRDLELHANQALMPPKKHRHNKRQHPLGAFQQFCMELHGHLLFHTLELHPARYTPLPVPKLTVNERPPLNS